MAERYHRSQLLLEPEQHDRLRRIADREERSMSDVARELIAFGLAARDRDQEARNRRRRSAMKQLKRIRVQVRARQGEYPGDLVGEARREREERAAQVRQGAE